VPLRPKVIRVLTLVACGLGASKAADAYIGPGAGLSVIGTAVAFVGAVIFAVIGLVWYPLKRLFGALRHRGSSDDGEKAAQS
jgi:hypothetical protein